MNLAQNVLSVLSKCVCVCVCEGEGFFLFDVISLFGGKLPVYSLLYRCSMNRFDHGRNFQIFRKSKTFIDSSCFARAFENAAYVKQLS